jgi:hypothetical protein
MLVVLPLPLAGVLRKSEMRTCQLEGCETELTPSRGGFPKKFCSGIHKKRAFNAAHREVLLERSRAYEATHRQERTAYRETHRAKAAAWREAHREEARVYADWYRTTTAGVLAELRSNAKRRGTR